MRCWAFVRTSWSHRWQDHFRNEGHPHRFFAKPTVPAYIERFRIGVVRGLLGKCKGTWLGTRGLVHIAAHDNKGLFLFPILTGRSEGPRGEYADGGIFPTWVCASGGQNEKIAYCIGDSDITTCWYVDETRESVGAYKGKPYLAKGEYPPSLYHQATHDAAFAVLESSFFIPGHGSSGKFHVYFAKATLASRRAGRSRRPSGKPEHRRRVSLPESLQGIPSQAHASSMSATRPRIPTMVRD